MWSLNLERLRPLVPDGNLGVLAIESGTCRGNGTRVLARAFARVVSLELSAALYRAARTRFAGAEFSHVTLVRGNSAELLPALLACEAPASPVFFFLDAHWSGDASVDWSQSQWQGYGVDTAHLAAPGSFPTGPEQCPLAEELRAIAEHHEGAAFILIDDMKNIPPSGPGLRSHGFKGEDWSHLSREALLAIVGPRLAFVHELEDPDQWFIGLRAGIPPASGIPANRGN